MEMMDSGRRLSRRQEKRLLEAAADVTRTQFDSPERAECPPSEQLELLARRRYRLMDSRQLVDHIGTCSPCFMDYTRYRVAHKRRVRISYAIMSAAAGIALALLIAYSLHTPGAGRAPVRKEVARSPEPVKEVAELVLDLRKMGVTRSEEPGGRGKGGKEGPLRLPRANLSLSVYLPIGSEDGIYEVALTGGSPEPMLTVAGEAKLENHIEVLPLRLDLTNFPPGRYELRLRRAQSQWRTYTVLLE